MVVVNQLKVTSLFKVLVFSDAVNLHPYNEDDGARAECHLFAKLAALNCAVRRCRLNTSGLTLG